MPHHPSLPPALNLPGVLREPAAAHHLLLLQVTLPVRALEHCFPTFNCSFAHFAKIRWSGDFQQAIRRSNSCPTWKCANCSPLCEASTTASVPMSVVTSPTGVHMVNSWAVPRDMYTLSTWAPVNASCVGSSYSCQQNFVKFQVCTVSGEGSL